MKKNDLHTKINGAARRSGKTVKQRQEDLRISKLLKRMALEQNQSIHFYEDIVETIHDPLIVLNSGLRVLYANQRIFSAFKVNARETIGTLV